MEDSLEGDASLHVERLLKNPGGLHAILMTQILHMIGTLLSHKLIHRRLIIQTNSYWLVRSSRTLTASRR